MADINEKLQPHQARVVERITHNDQPGLVVAHGLGSGKCVRGNTPIATNRGVVAIKSLFSESEIPEYGDSVLHGAGLKVSSLGRDYHEKIQGVRFRYVQKLPDDESTVVVTTHRGNSVELTRQHEIPILGKSGCVEWVPAGLVKQGDFLCVPRSTSQIGDACSIDEDLRYVITWLVTEGHSQNTGGHYAHCITQHNKDFLLDIKSRLGRLGVHGGIDKDYTLIQFSGKQFTSLIESMGYRRVLSAKKVLPENFLNTDDECVRRVFGDCFNAEGYMSSANAEIISASPELSNQYQYLALRLGSRSSRRMEMRCATNGTRIKRPYWRNHFSGDDIPGLLKSCVSGLKREKIELSSNKKRNTNTGVPVEWFLDIIKSFGLSSKCFGVSIQNERTWADYTCVRVAAEIVKMSSVDGVLDLEKKSKKLGGTAGVFVKRTLKAFVEHKHDLIKCAEKLVKLSMSNLRFEQIESVVGGEVGGYVYDVEVDSDDHFEKNYVGGFGGLYLHNTYSSIAMAKAIGGDANVVVPSALQENFAKELRKHVGSTKGFNIESMQGVARKGYNNHADTLIVDEGHRMRNAGSATYQALRHNGAKKRIILTASPFYNNPAEIAPLVNMAAGHRVFSENQSEFMKRYVKDSRVEPGFFAKHFKGIKPGVTQDINPAHRKELEDHLHKWVDYHKNSTTDFPEVDRENVMVPMAKRQQEVYDTVMGRAPAWLKYKVRKGLPPSKQESKDLNAFLSGVRQVSNSTRGFDTQHAAEEPKIQTAFDRLHKRMDEDPKYKAVVYSSYLNSGVQPYSDRLKASGIPYGEYTGEMKKKDRDQLVRDYNAGSKRVILMSSAGGEGLDLKGTRNIQILEPHFNVEKIRQVEGRGIRFRSHSELPPEQRRVLVEQYLSTRGKTRFTDKLGLTNPGRGTDEYLRDMAERKDALNQKFNKMMDTDNK